MKICLIHFNKFSDSNLIPFFPWPKLLKLIGYFKVGVLYIYLFYHKKCTKGSRDTISIGLR